MQVYALTNFLRATNSLTISPGAQKFVIYVSKDPYNEVFFSCSSFAFKDIEDINGKVVKLHQFSK